MVRIHDRFLNSVLYLYPTEEAANNNNHSGGTGFLYGIPIEGEENEYYVFAVTCRHLISGPEVFIRVNTIEGGFVVIGTQKSEWHTHLQEDLAIYSMPYDPAFRQLFVGYDQDVADQASMERLRIGPGDDVCLAGRFLLHGGEDQNDPMVRFGNIAMMPNAPIYNPTTNIATAAFLVDMRIRSGFSGSPVFFQYSERYSIIDGQLSGPWSGQRLLGVAWGTFVNNESVRIRGHEYPEYTIAISEGLVCVTPAWRIPELIVDLAETKRNALGSE